ncbi:MAG: DNRLRE domain-containing protein [candidate division Zixibacteria bacterium]|nr:DNRLRE domain-containing protein [candidate division Zixibacteria bacterium]
MFKIAESITSGLIFIILVLLADNASALGPRNHWFTAEAAIAHLYSQNEIELAQLLENHRDELYCGAMSPDFGWVWAEPLAAAMHASSWTEAYLETIRGVVTYPFAEWEQREIAWLMGTASHGYSDAAWHWGYRPDAFLPRAMEEDNTSEETIEYGCDIFMLFEHSEFPLAPDYYWPLELWAETFQRIGFDWVTSDTLTTGTDALQAGIAGENLTGWLTYLALRAQIPFSHDNYEDYYPGGIEDCGALVAQQMIRLWHILQDDSWTYQHSYMSYGYDDAYGCHLLASLPDNNTGAEPRAQVGFRTGGEDRMGALLKFVLPDDPPEAFVEQALLKLHFAEREYPQIDTKQLGIYQVLKPWGEGAGEDSEPLSYQGSAAENGWATHDYAQFGSLPWDVPGCEGEGTDRDSEAVDIVEIDPMMGTEQWISWDVTDLVHSWNENPPSNYGIIARDDSGIDTEGVFNFISEEGITYYLRPTLEVKWRPETPVSVSMIPDNPPIIIPAGGSFNYTGILINNTRTLQIRDVWIMMEVPGQGIYGPLDRINNIPIQALDTLSAAGIQQNVPVYAPLGDYNYIAYCGDYPEDIVDSASFQFTVIAPEGDGSKLWSVDRWFDGTDEYEISTPAVRSVNNYPNPFNARTNISFVINGQSSVKLEIFNLRGQRVEILVNGFLPEGFHAFDWDATDVTSGIYFYRLSTETERINGRMVLLR